MKTLVEIGRGTVVLLGRDADLGALTAALRGALVAEHRWRDDKKPWGVDTEQEGVEIRVHQVPDAQVEDAFFTRLHAEMRAKQETAPETGQDVAAPTGSDSVATLPPKDEPPPF